MYHLAKNHRRHFFIVDKVRILYDQGIFNLFQVIEKITRSFYRSINMNRTIRKKLIYINLEQDRDVRFSNKNN